MDFFTLGDHITVKDLNAITYLLRRFKRLNTGLRLGSLSLDSDYGSFVFDKPLTSVGGNFILEQEVNISSSDCLRNCFYSFVFSVIDVNTSGTVNKRKVKVTGDTGENGSLFITLPTDLIENDEVILPDFELDIVFDEHEYYTPVVDVVNVDLVSDKRFVGAGEVATVTATLTDSNGDLLACVPCTFIVNGVIYSEITDSDGQAEWSYTGTGLSSKIDIQVVSEVLTIYDSVMAASVNKNKVILGYDVSHPNWLISNGDVIIDWGDGTTSKVNNPTNYLTHNYTDGETDHTIAFFGDIIGIGQSCLRDVGLISIFIPDTVTSLGKSCFGVNDELTSVIIPNSVESIGDYCFEFCRGLISVIIPSSVESIGDYCFRVCDSLVDYQLYWKNTEIIEYNSIKMPVNNNTYFTIPQGQKNQYIAKNYPNNIKIRGYDLSLTTDKTVITEDETSTITAILTHNMEPISDETVSYIIRQGATVIDTGSDTTNSDGEIEVEYTGTAIGKINIIFTYDTLTESTIIYDTITYDNATTSDHNDIWVVNSGSLPALLTRGNNYSTLAQANTGNIGWAHYQLGDRTNKIVEFDIQTTGTDSRVGLRNGTSVLNVINGLNGKWNHIIIDFDNNIIYNTTTGTTKNISSSTINRIYLEARGNGEMIYFKNFIVYSSGGSSKIDTSISISSDKSSYYTDESIVLSGVLVDDNNLPLVNANVKIYNGASLIDTVSTDNTGTYEKTITSLSAGSYSFKAVYDGDDTYQDSISSSLSVIVQNHTYSLSIFSDKQIILTSESVTISGTLLKDSSAYTSQSVDLYDGANKITTLTTDNNGEYEETISGLSAGVHTFKTVHSNVESSTINITVNEPTHDYSLSVASTKDVLSYAESESATVTATLTDNGSAAAGETLSYVIKHGTTTIDSGSDTTDSSGQISFTYASTGIGDVTVEVDFNTDLQETIVIEDCLKTYMQTYTSASVVNYNLPSTFLIEFTLWCESVGGNTGSPYLRFNTNNGPYVGKGSSNSLNVGIITDVLNQLPVETDKKFYLSYGDNVATLTDGTDSISSNVTLTKLYSINSGGSNGKIKNVKIKAL